MAVTAIVRFALPEDKTHEAAKAAFEASAPLYQSVQGLVRKYYLLSRLQNSERFGSAQDRSS